MNSPKKFQTKTVEVVALTEPPAAGFMAGGKRVECGGKVRVPLFDARGLEKSGKARIIGGSERDEWL